MPFPRSFGHISEDGRGDESGVQARDGEDSEEAANERDGRREKGGGACRPGRKRPRWKISFQKASRQSREKAERRGVYSRERDTDGFFYGACRDNSQKRFRRPARHAADIRDSQKRPYAYFNPRPASAQDIPHGLKRRGAARGENSRRYLRSPCFGGGRGEIRGAYRGLQTFKQDCGRRGALRDLGGSH